MDLFIDVLHRNVLHLMIMEREELVYAMNGLESRAFLIFFDGLLRTGITSN